MLNCLKGEDVQRLSGRTLKKREKSKKFLGFSTIDFQKFYRLSTFRVRIRMPEGEKNTPIPAGLGYLFCVVSRRMSFCTIRDRFGCRCGYVTEGNTRAILKGVHGDFKEGVICLCG